MFRANTGSYRVLYRGYAEGTGTREMGFIGRYRGI